jgi:hypothetical protein
MTLRDDLIAAKALIDTPEKWAKGSEVDTTEGRRCAAVACNDFALAHSMFGRLQSALPSPHRERAASLGVAAIFDFNDDPRTTHADIMALFDRAIAAASQS